MSKLLLDTHLFLWWIDQPGRVQSSWVESIADPANTVHVSAVVAWEIETKKRSGKLAFGHSVSAVATEFAFEPLSITTEHAELAGALDWDHRDPFDRMLVAQALTEDLLLVTVDAVMKSAPGVRVL